MIRAFLRLVELTCAVTLFHRRVRTLLCLALILGALGVQLLLVIHLLRSPTSRGSNDVESGSSSKADELIRRNPSRRFCASRTWRAVRDVVEAARSVRLPLFALEANGPVQEPNQSGRSRNSSITTMDDNLYCKYYCTATKVQFGTIAAFSNRREPQFIEQLTSKAFAVDTVRVPNPNMVELVVELTAHFIIRPLIAKLDRLDPSASPQSEVVRSPDVIIHIVVFHDRPDNFWWHAAVSSGHPLRPLLAGLPFVNSTGAHSKVEIGEGIRDGIRLLLPAQSFRPSAEFIDCNRTRSEEFFAKNGGRDSSPNSELFRIRVRKLLLKVKTLLAKHSIPFWLSSGTCLGWFRQCDVIPYTTDVDLGVFIEDFRPAMIDEFSTHDLALTHVFGRPGDSYELSFLDVVEQLKLDVFFFYREANYTWNGGTQARTGLKFKYVFPPFRMCLTEFLDLLVQVPCPTLPYIEANYGADWHRPVRHWDWKRSPPNVRENGVWPMEQWNQLIQLFPLPPY